MIAYLFYTKDSPGELQMTALAAELGRLQVDSETIEADSRRGANLAETYDITSRPAIVLAASDGTPIERWQQQLPSPTDISYLAHR